MAAVENGEILINDENGTETIPKEEKMDVDDIKPSNVDEIECNLSDSMSPSKNFEAQNLRRSQRASAKRAQERLRGEISADDETSPNKKDADAKDHEEDDELSEPKAKVPKMLINLATLDPTDAHFGVQVDEDGDVVYLSEESEISSLHTFEIDFVRKAFEKVKCKELTEEQQVERNRMIRDLKVQLSIEECRLALLRKMRDTQRIPPAKVTPIVQQQRPAGVHQSAVPQLIRGTNVHSNSATKPPPAYRPPVAAAAVAQHSKNSATPVASKQHLSNNLSSSGGRSANIGVANSVMPSQQKISSSNSSKPLVHATSGETTGRSTSNVHHAASDGQTPAQRQAAAKLALRKQLEKTLLQIPPPKPPPPELQVVPNPNQPDFLYLVGLDEIVERLMVNKEAHLHKQLKHAAAADGTTPTTNGDSAKENQRPKSKFRSCFAVFDRPLSCAQCGTDFTPYWKRVERNRIFCENCVRVNQKKSLKAEHTNLLKQAFVKALQQEQEIDRQIKDGTFNFSTLPTGSTGNKHIMMSNNGKVSSTSNHHPPAAASAAASIKQQHHHQQVPSYGSSTKAVNLTSKSGVVTSKSQTVPTTSSKTTSSASKISSNAAAASNLFNAANFGSVGFPAAQMLGVGWNPLFASRFPAAAMAAAAAAASSTSNNATAAARQNWQNLPKDFLKNLQQLQQQQQNVAAAVQRQFLLDMMPRPQKWK